MTRQILVALADTHGGSKLGLLQPDTVLWEQGPEGELIEWIPELSATQEYLFECYCQDIENAIELAAGDPVIVLHVGDITQGIKYPALLVSNRIADQFIIGEENLAPWFRYPNVTAARLAMGTASHVFGEGSSEVLIARALAQRFADRDIKGLYHGLLDVQGLTVDYAHHGPGPGIRDWTKGNQVRYYLKSLIATEWKTGRQPARVTLRGHYHSWIRETVYDDLGGQSYTFDMFLLPAYCGMGDHGHQATRSAWLHTIGLVAFEIIDGDLAGIHPFIRTLDLRTKESL